MRSRLDIEGSRESFLLQLLIKNKANVDARDDQEQTPLHLASWFGRVYAVQVSVELEWY